jgi:hypothetical protein
MRPPVLDECDRHGIAEHFVDQDGAVGGHIVVATDVQIGRAASIEEPELIERILAHRRERGEEAAPRASLGARAPPQASLL